MKITELSEVLKKGGVVGAGGAGFPSYAKLNEKADTIILNCAECEPLLQLHKQMLSMYAYEIMSALREVKEAVGAEKVIIAVKHSYKKAVEAVKSLLPDFAGMEIGFLPEAYPSGDEVVTIYETTGRVVEAGQIPITVGVIVYNVETMFNAYNIIKNNKGVTEKYITVTGAVKHPVTVKVPLGITYNEVIALAGGTTIDEYEIIAGGPMTGPIAKGYDVVTKTSNALIILPPEHYVVKRKEVNINISMKRAMSACCQCRYCTDLCPRNLLGHPIDPARLMRAVSTNCTTDPAPFLNANFCCGCSLCEMFSCFQGLSPKAIIGSVRGELAKNGVPRPEAKMKEVSPNRSGRLISVERLIARLGLEEYKAAAPYEEKNITYGKVKLMLSQNIGAPSVPCVSVGDKVTVGDKIANAAPDKLSVDLHASISGEVAEVTERYIIIKA